MDDRMHNRRPSDEASMILRKGAGMNFNMIDKTASLPISVRHPSYTSESSSFHDFSGFFRQGNTLGRCVCVPERVCERECV